MRHFVLGILFGLLFQSCYFEDTPKKFDRNVWLKNQKLQKTFNPRIYMTDDLIANYLKPGMHRDSILSLLGSPSEDAILMRVPRGIELPASLSLMHPGNMENEKEATANFNKWYKDNTQPDTLMLYTIGMDIIDENFLVIKFRPDKKAYEFWTEQH